MEQLGQLQRHYRAFKKRNCEVLVVFREEQDGVAGLKRARATAKAEFPLLLDLDAQHTGRYSRGEFAAYIIDRRGIVRSKLSGTKTVRPAAEEILSKIDELGLR
ncbi:MAG: hypothetical protein D6725_16345 [Planctomycetota bacterium]|nr:MAG: hypothetical protein D6725_16345 [Planctomycetota bacterium]